MRDAADHLAHGFQPVAPLKSIFQLANARDVMDQHQLTGQRSGFIVQVCFRPAQSSRLMEAPAGYSS